MIELYNKSSTITKDTGTMSMPLSSVSEFVSLGLTCKVLCVGKPKGELNLSLRLIHEVPAAPLFEHQPYDIAQDAFVPLLQKTSSEAISTDKISGGDDVGAINNVLETFNTFGSGVRILVVACLHQILLILSQMGLPELALEVTVVCGKCAALGSAAVLKIFIVGFCSWFLRNGIASWNQDTY